MLCAFVAIVPSMRNRTVIKTNYSSAKLVATVRDNGQSAALLSVSGLVMYFSVHSETPSRIGKSLITRERGYAFGVF